MAAKKLEWFSELENDHFTPIFSLIEETTGKIRERDREEFHIDDFKPTAGWKYEMKEMLNRLKNEVEQRPEI